MKSQLKKRTSEAKAAGRQQGSTISLTFAWGIIAYTPIRFTASGSGHSQKSLVSKNGLSKRMRLKPNLNKPEEKIQ